MPATTTTVVAAPAPTVMAAPAMVETRMAAPATAPVAAVAAFQVPPPVSLTRGVPDPSSIEQQKQAYARSLDTQLQQGSAALLEEGKLKKQMIEQQAKTQLAQYQLQVEEQLKMSSMSVD